MLATATPTCDEGTDGKKWTTLSGDRLFFFESCSARAEKPMWDFLTGKKVPRGRSAQLIC